MNSLLAYNDQSYEIKLGKYLGTPAAAPLPPEKHEKFFIMQQQLPSLLELIKQGEQQATKEALRESILYAEVNITNAAATAKPPRISTWYLTIERNPLYPGIYLIETTNQGYSRWNGQYWCETAATIDEAINTAKRSVDMYQPNAHWFNFDYTPKQQQPEPITFTSANRVWLSTRENRTPPDGMYRISDNSSNIPTHYAKVERGNWISYCHNKHDAYTATDRSALLIASYHNFNYSPLIDGE